MRELMGHELGEIISDYIDGIGNRFMNPDYYTIVKYSGGSGELLGVSGKLLDKLGLSVPASMGKFYEELAGWPVVSEIRKTFPERVRIAIHRGETTEMNGFDILLETSERLFWINLTAIGNSTILFRDVDAENRHLTNYIGEQAVDSLTGLFNISSFKGLTEARIKADSEGRRNGDYAIVFFDIIKFKAVNDMFGPSQGDRLLRYIADCIKHTIGKSGLGCRIGSDRFVFMIKEKESELKDSISSLFDEIAEFDLPFEVACDAGVYVVTEENISVEAMLDRATLAQSNIKGSYTQRINFYTERMRHEMITEQEIVHGMNSALVNKEFVLYYQPQFNHSTGRPTGAEALVRWKNPKSGLIPPGLFIPIFEKNGFVTTLDMYVFEEACAFLRRALNRRIPVVPISTNFSRHDIFKKDFIEKLDSKRKKYDIPSHLLRIEITESAVIDENERVNEIVEKLHEHGYIVEMDDFGAGYSSLNVLKDINIDIIKLDLKFMEGNNNLNRGGTIVNSVVKMAKWLHMPVIAEGVETVSQADFLKSIGCNYIQGYLYAKPLPEEEFITLMRNSMIELPGLKKTRAIENRVDINFWNPESRETLIFNEFAGPAAIIDYHGGRLEYTRVNEKYIAEIGQNISENDIIESDVLECFDDDNWNIYMATIKEAIDTGEIVKCRAWHFADREKTKKICLLREIRMIGRNEGSYLFFENIRNVTEEELRIIELEEKIREINGKGK